MLTLGEVFTYSKGSSRTCDRAGAPRLCRLLVIPIPLLA